MADQSKQDELFGEIAVAKQWIVREKLERARVLQRCIAGRTRVDMSIGKVLNRMGLLTMEQVNQIIAEQQEIKAQEPLEAGLEKNTHSTECVTLILSPDKMNAAIAVAKNQVAPSIAFIKRMLVENGIVQGIVGDDLLTDRIERKSHEAIMVACGTAPEPGHPPEIRYYFDKDPLRIGTLLEDGTMDWKNRGEIPQVAAGELLCEKVGGDPGRPGLNVLGQEVLPARIKDPPLKPGKGAERSEDGRRILAKINGTPRLGNDGRINVFSVLPIEADVGLETGHIEFDGHIEVNGGIASGYTVKGKSLNTREIQNAEIDIEEDVVCFGGAYASTIKAGGHFKVSHLHNCNAEVLGDLVVEKEIFNCTIAVNGRCHIESGRIIATKIIAKKGILVKDVGTLAGRPSELTVGIDFKYAAEIKLCRKQIAELEQRREEISEDVIALKAQSDQLESELGRVAQEQDNCMVHKRRLEEKLKADSVAEPEKRALMEKLIAELGGKYEILDQHIKAIMSEDDGIRTRVAQHKVDIQSFEEQIVDLTERKNLLEDAAKLDPGMPVVKAYGMVFSGTLIIGPNRKILIQNELRNVRIAEYQEEGKPHQIKMSNLK